MKINIHEIYGNVYFPKDFNEILILLLEDSSTKDFLVPKLWRGQCNISWPINSSAHRRIELGSVTKDGEQSLVNYEKRLLNAATHQGYRLQNGRNLSDFELLARLQHHGAATRLLDFSKNAMVALWFACKDQPSETGILIGIHTHFVGGGETSIYNEKYSEIVSNAAMRNFPTVYEPPIVSPRIAAQHALFLFSKFSIEQYGSLKLPEENEAKIFIAITPKLKESCLNILESVFDYRNLTLFPDIDGFGIANSQNISQYIMNRW